MFTAISNFGGSCPPLPNILDMTGQKSERQKGPAGNTKYVETIFREIDKEELEPSYFLCWPI